MSLLCGDKNVSFGNSGIFFHLSNMLCTVSILTYF